VKIAILVGSTRPGRKGTAVGRWAYDAARERDDAEFELVELEDQHLPLLDEPVDAGAANRQYERASTRAWSELVDSFDGFVWVTPEYNHGVPAAMKNAVDLLWPEWNNKVAGFVGYGFDGATRAVEQWRGILAAAVMFTVRSQVALLNHADWKDGVFTPLGRRAAELNRVLDQVVRTAAVVRQLR
jgi:NAD(P)H-dependent FMN reductase